MSEEMKVHTKGMNKIFLFVAITLIVIGLIVALVLLVPTSVKAKKVEEQLDLGAKYLSELNYEQAIVAYETVIGIDPKCEEAYLALADVYIATGEFDKAEEILKKAEEEIGPKVKNTLEEKRKEVGKRRQEQTGTDLEHQMPTSVLQPTLVPDEEEISENVFSYSFTDNGTISIRGLLDEQLEEVYIPQQIEGYPVTSIEAVAFSNCSRLTVVTIPESVRDIGEWAFFGCSSLTSIEIPEGVTSIRENTFSGCSSLKSVKIPENVTRIENSAFSDCRSLTSIEIPKGVTYIEAGAFSQCDSLTNVVIPDSVTHIGACAFAWCDSLANIEVPDSVINIGYDAFDGTPWLEQQKEDKEFFIVGDGVLVWVSPLIADEFVIPQDVTCLSGTYKERQIESIVVPDGIVSVEGAFDRCFSIKSVELPSTITNIGYSAFSNCGSLTNIEIPDGVTNIGDYAFTGCSSLDVTIPSSVKQIGVHAFSYCKSLTNIEIPLGVTIIENCAFKQCESLTEIVLPYGVTEIKEQAFADCTSLTSIEIPASVTSIKSWAFEGCSSLETVIVEKGSYAEQWAKENGINIVVQ